MIWYMQGRSKNCVYTNMDLLFLRCSTITTTTTAAAAGTTTTTITSTSTSEIHA